MKKYVVGFLIGASLMFSSQIYGAGAKLLGEKVDTQMDVKINDKTIGSAVVINGTSYLPVRAIANEVGLEVSVTGSAIILSNPSADELAEVARKEEEGYKAKEAKLAALQGPIGTLKNNITSTEKEIDYIKNVQIPSLEGSDKTIDKSRLEGFKKKLVEKEAQLVELKKKLAELEAQKAAIESE